MKKCNQNTKRNFEIELSECALLVVSLTTYKSTNVHIITNWKLRKTSAMKILIISCFEYRQLYSYLPATILCMIIVCVCVCVCVCVYVCVYVCVCV